MNKEIIYQLFPRIFGNRNLTRKRNGTIAENGCGKFNDITLSVLKRIKELGTTYIWYTGIIRHATTTDYSQYDIPKQHHAIVKGKAGSPYAIVDYYDVDPDLADDVKNRKNEFVKLIERTHKVGLGVIIDFVPNHVARQYQSICKPKEECDLGENDNETDNNCHENNFYYICSQKFETLFDIDDYIEYPARVTGNDCFSAHPTKDDWYDTIKLNYNNHVTWEKMLNIMLYWASLGIDGFRCDMAEMVPLEFWRWALHKLKSKYPNIKIIGEVYQPYIYRDFISVGFDYLYDKVGMYDCVRDILSGKRYASDITYQWQTTDDITSNMLYFLENHDEQRIASDFFMSDARNAIPALVILSLMRNNPFMLYSGQEVGEQGNYIEGFSGYDGRSSIFDYWSLSSINHCYFDRRKMNKKERILHNAYCRILNIAKTEKAISEGAFFDLTYANPHISDKTFSFIRKKDENIIIVVASFDENKTHLDSDKIFLPQHSFEYLQLEKTTYVASDLLSQKKYIVDLRPDFHINVYLSNFGIAILSLKMQNEN